MKIVRNVLLAACTVALTGCLVPEKFAAKVDVKSDGAYSFSYSGTAMNALVASQLSQGGGLSDKDVKALDAEAERLKKDKEIRKAIHKGNGRYELEIEQARLARQHLKVLNTFSVQTDNAGVMTISSVELKDKDKKELARLGLIVDGTLEVRVPKDVEVLSHNATATPTLGFGTYSWKIGRIDERPMMRLKFKDLAADSSSKGTTVKGAANERSSKLDEFLKEGSSKPSRYNVH